MMIDWARVIQLQEEVGADDFDEVVDMFIEEVGLVIDRLRDCTDPSDLSSDMHFLKGSALSLGFRAFSTLCSNGEVTANAGKSDTVDLVALIACYDDSKGVFLEEYQVKVAA
jgi:HPt (histidine-containing phosphotransfer) domain-containing protein